MMKVTAGRRTGNRWNTPRFTGLVFSLVKRLQIRANIAIDPAISIAITKLSIATPILLVYSLM